MSSSDKEEVDDVSELLCDEFLEEDGEDEDYDEWGEVRELLRVATIIFFMTFAAFFILSETEIGRVVQFSIVRALGVKSLIKWRSMEDRVTPTKHPLQNSKVFHSIWKPQDELDLLKSFEDELVWPNEIVPVEISIKNDLENSVILYMCDERKREDLLIQELAADHSVFFAAQVGQVWRIQDAKKGSFIKTFPISRSMNRKTILTGSSGEDAFLLEYYARNNLVWLNSVPRGPVRHPMISRTRKNYRILPVPQVNADGEKEKRALRTVQKIESNPRVFMIENFLSNYEADSLVALAKNLSLHRSRVGGRIDGKLGTEHHLRTSRNTWIPCTGQNSSQLVNRVCKRSFNLLGYKFDDKNWQNVAESLQLVHYNASQEYHGHHDYFPPREQLQEYDVQRGNNRLATLIFYLNDVEEGGHTVFPLNGTFEEPALDVQISTTQVANVCQRSPGAGGLSISPKKGSALLFYNMLEDGNLDVQSFHAGCPVIKGEKWIANFWFWEEQVPTTLRQL
eukprot:TRINITY_DN18911_c0_g1_i1.p1 TRINITY_DN18911_c0_g1~~TRINITY_DN18911_c0_g1_i1.p1  ORF type:complete len:509 (-),score=121.68 TRINITY_DN18911_c0_g1_i1:53-1579(-)